MNTQEILASKKTENILWILIIGTFILSILLGRYVLEPQKESSTAQTETTTEMQLAEVADSEAGSIEILDPTLIIEPPVATTVPVERETTTEQDSFATSIERYERRTITVDNQRLLVAVADSPEKQILGLSFTKSFPSVDGLLFEYEPNSNPSIWMKDMNYNIDILWLDADYNIVHRENNVSPDTYPESFSSPLPSNYVLELPIS